MRHDNTKVIFEESICGVPSLELGAANAQRARKDFRSNLIKRSIYAGKRGPFSVGQYLLALSDGKFMHEKMRNSISTIYSVV